MQRRKFLTSVGALTAGSAAAMGTGAFTSVDAQRSVSVSVAGDAGAYLGMSAVNATNGAYADESGDDGRLTINFDSISENSQDNTVSTGGSGVNPNSKTVAEDVFRVTNQGTQAVEVDLADGDNGNTAINTSNPTSPGPGTDAVYIYFNSGGASSITSGNYTDANDAELDPGDVIQVDVVITTGTDTSFPTLNNLDLTATASGGTDGNED